MKFYVKYDLKTIWLEKKRKKKER